MHKRIMLLAAILLLWTAPALAFQADSGNRALPLYGVDRVSGDWVELSDYQGKWVLLENWATW
ncbi:MAG: hypothetical protein R3F46_15300 [bacterium]